MVLGAWRRVGEGRYVADSISIDCPAFLAEGGLCGMDMMDALLI